MVEVLPAKPRVGKERRHRDPYLDLLWLTIFPRIDHELPSACDDEAGYDSWNW